MWGDALKKGAASGIQGDHRLIFTQVGPAIGEALNPTVTCRISIALYVGGGTKEKNFTIKS